MNPAPSLQLTKRFLATVLVAYFLLGAFYWFALLYTSNFQFNSWDQTIVNYSWKIIYSIPVYYIIFMRLRHWPVRKRLLMHLLLCPLYLVFWRYTFYGMTDALNIGRLQGTGAFWDIYIGTLIYFVQFGFLHLYEFHQQVQWQQQQAAALAKANAEARTQALTAQIQPHFLFNTLNSINASLPAEQEKTRSLIAQLADSFRYALRSTHLASVPLYQELAFIKDLLALEKERLGERLRFEEKIDAALTGVEIAPMLLQPLLENAIRHGVAPLINGGRIVLSIGIDQNELIYFSLINDCPQDAEATSVSGHGLGLQNVAQRLKHLYNADLHFHKANGQAEVHFSIPKTLLCKP